jgi:CheY-like chemotaxis protein
MVHTVEPAEQIGLPQAQRLENLGQLAGGVAHDVNNLLAVILNCASFASEELTAATEPDWARRYETARNDLGQIKLAADQAAGLTRQLLAFCERTSSGETVLVVEDETALREVTRRIFARNGYQVITAANGPEALGIARAHPGDVHLLVTDVVMPHMLGQELAEKMQAVRPGIAVLFMSGCARPVLASQGGLGPGEALVEKPFSEADLLAKARQVLDRHAQGA